MRPLLFLALFSLPAHADITPPPRPPWTASCRRQFERALAEVGREGFSLLDEATPIDVTATTVKVAFDTGSCGLKIHGEASVDRVPGRARAWRRRWNDGDYDSQRRVRRLSGGVSYRYRNENDGGAPSHLDLFISAFEAAIDRCLDND